MRRHIAALFATSGHSGVDRVVARLMPEFGRADIDLDLLSIRNHGPRLPVLPANVHRIALSAAHKSTAVLPLIGYLRRRRPEAILSANHKLNVAVLRARIWSRTNARVAIRLGMAPEAFGELRPTHAKRLERSMRHWYPQADAVITPSRGVADTLIERAGLIPERVHAIPNPLPVDEIRAQAREPFEHPAIMTEEPIILGVGELSKRKDFVTLMQAFTQVRQQLRCRLVILGEGRERAFLERLAAELGVQNDVWLPGFLANPYRVMARAAVFVLSSRFEGFANVLAEALALGIPCVSTDCPHGPREILRNGKLGPLVPVGEHVAMAEAIHSCLAHPQDAQRLQAAANKYAADRIALSYLAALGLEQSA